MQRKVEAKVEAIVEEICPKDSYEIGYADLRGLLGSEFTDYQYGISIIRKLDAKVINGIKKGPTKDYYRLYDSVNNELNNKAFAISEKLGMMNRKALPVKATVHDSEPDDEYKRYLRFKISHKMVATRSGLGWIGKTDLFISKELGPRVRLATVLTDVPLVAKHPPITESMCGECTICVKACPAGAANGLLWNTQLDRNDFYNPFKCREYCREISKHTLRKEISLCGICVSVCPRG